MIAFIIGVVIGFAIRSFLLTPRPTPVRSIVVITVGPVTDQE